MLEKAKEMLIFTAQYIKAIHNSTGGYGQDLSEYGIIQDKFIVPFRFCPGALTF